MAKINLCVDIGNTNAKAAVYADGILQQYYKPFDETMLAQYRAQQARVLVCASGKNEALQKRIKPHEYLTHLTPLPIALDYHTPHTLGSDRIAAAVGAHSIDPLATWLVLDLGTCLTLDLIHKNIFLGGLISPGVQMRLKAMNVFTAGLPLVKPDYTTSFPGKSTEHCLQVGVCQSIRFEILGYIQEINHSYPHVKIADGSNIPFHFGKEIENMIFARPKLVIEGLNHILDYNAQL